MKILKIIIPVLIVALIAAFLFYKNADQTNKFRQALYSGDLVQVEKLLKAHPSLANAPHMEVGRGGRGNFSGQVGDWTPLHVAADMGDPEMIRLPVRYHARVDARDKRGLTPLLWTAFGGKRAAAAALLESGADINARGPDGRSTLDLAKLSLDLGLVELLRQHGAKE